MDKFKYHTSLLKAYKKAHPNKAHLTCDHEVSVIWNQLKKSQAFEKDVKAEIMK